MNKRTYIYFISIVVAIGGFLMGFDASVISGVTKFVKAEFQLTELELGWAVSSLTLTSTLAMLIAGPLSDKFGRKKILFFAALLYFISALGSAFAPSFSWLVAARMLGGFGVGASLIIAPLYIAEIAPPEKRGQLVSFNQLNIVLGISVAFFTNYFILQMGESESAWALDMGFRENNWRWMLGIEAIPAIIYFLALLFVPRSPRWLAMKGKTMEALEVLKRATTEDNARAIIDEVESSTQHETTNNQISGLERLKSSLGKLFSPAMRFVLTIGLVIGILQQITGINSVFFYAPMIFEQSGIGTDASFAQAIYVGLVNLVFTLLAIALIDKLGRKPLLIFGVSGIVVTMFLLSYSFNKATYQISDQSISQLPNDFPKEQLASIKNVRYENDVDFKNALKSSLGKSVAEKYLSDLIKGAANINSWLVLLSILGFVASFAISVGPVMWVLFSELFPNSIRGIAISFVGLVNSAVSFFVQYLFPWELENLGSSLTFLIYGIFAVLGLFFIIFKLPETKGKSLEELEKELVG